MTKIPRRLMLGQALTATAGASLFSACAQANGAHPLAPQQSHHAPKAKNMIFVFLTGGFSHVDTFDPKPGLDKHHGKSVPAVHLRGTDTQPLLRSPFKFSQHGESGMAISELFPQLGMVADDLCVIRSLHTDIVEHFQASMAMHTGSATIPLPSIGSWLSYGLGTFNRNLPSYMVLAEHLPYGGSQVFDCNFLPPIHQGVRITPGENPIPNLKPSGNIASLQSLQQQLLKDANALHAEQRSHNLNLKARMNSFETAQGIMRVAPEIFDLSRETQTTLDAYGVESNDNKSIAWQCLVARRLVEQGVRVVELIDSGSNNNWDAHGNMQDHRPKAKRVDQALAGLITDLKQRGLFDDTLVVICTEFGRTPWSDNGAGRNHYARAFSSLLTGAGVKGGTVYGETDEFGIDITKDPCHVHDYHATMLHLMGIDHTKLTYRYAGRDYRLTDVHGNVLHEILT